MKKTAEGIYYHSGDSFKEEIKQEEIKSVESIALQEQKNEKRN